MGSQALAETAPVSHKPKAKRLTQLDVAWLIKAHKDGLTQTAIAERLGVTQGAISRWIESTTDSTDVAKSYLRGSALRMAQNIVHKGAAKDHVAALKGLSVLDEGVQSGLTIQIGGNGNDIKIALLSPLSGKALGEGQ